MGNPRITGHDCFYERHGPSVSTRARYEVFAGVPGGPKMRTCRLHIAPAVDIVLSGGIEARIRELAELPLLEG